MKYKSGGIIRENDPDGISEVTRGVRSHKNGINGGNTQLQAFVLSRITIRIVFGTITFRK
jgi:hypothetical protein